MFTVIADTAQAAGLTTANGVGTKVRVEASPNDSRLFLPLRDVGPAEVLVLLEEF